MSCVLKISSPHGSALLPGDIGKAQEALLLDRHPPATLQSDVVLVPHHGSQTSSSTAFIAATQARWAVFQVGYRNRYGHPKTDVWDAWQGSLQRFRTDQTGALQFQFTKNKTTIRSARQHEKRVWQLTPGLSHQNRAAHAQKPQNQAIHSQ
jgi:competence protein ComEC